MRRNLYIAVALLTFTIGFLVADTGKNLNLALPIVFVVFLLTKQIASLQVKLHYLKVALITLVIWTPFAVITLHVAVPGGGSCEIYISGEDNQQTTHLSDLSEDELHELYEAAAESANYSETSKAIYQKFWCVTSDGRFDGRIEFRDDIEPPFRCVRDDGTIYEFDSARFTKFRESHNRWQAKNTAFIESITIVPTKAQEYVEKRVDAFTLQPLPHYPYVEY